MVGRLGAEFHISWNMDWIICLQHVWSMRSSFLAREEYKSTSKSQKLEYWEHSQGVYPRN